MHLADLNSSKEEENRFTRSIVEDHAVGGISPCSTSSQDSFTPQFQAPQFTLPLNDISIRENETLQLKCIVMAEPIPIIRWTYNGKEIQADNRWKVLISVCMIN